MCAQRRPHALPSLCQAASAPARLVVFTHLPQHAALDQLLELHERVGEMDAALPVPMVIVSSGGTRVGAVCVCSEECIGHKN